MPIIEVRQPDDVDVPRVASVLGLARLFQGDGCYLVAWRGDEPLGHLHQRRHVRGTIEIRVTWEKDLTTAGAH